mmetsp:Transcript_28812/g.75939  ORF Transcript_28812/g.75939 Transcript_28812/m.75939 type:complete len:91 (+) Transcript_28812:877-1149(+)
MLTKCLPVCLDSPLSRVSPASRKLTPAIFRQWKNMVVEARCSRAIPRRAQQLSLIRMLFERQIEVLLHLLPNASPRVGRRQTSVQIVRDV